MGNYSQYKNVNTTFGGTEGIVLPAGDSSTTLGVGRAASPTVGTIRYNTVLGLSEQYTATGWQAISSPPALSSISPTFFTAAGETITITGSNFVTPVQVAIIGKTGSSYAAAVATFVNSTTATFVTTSAMASDANDPFDIKLTNPTGLAGTLAGALNLTQTFAFTQGANTTLATFYDASRTSYNGLQPTGSGITESDVSVVYTISAGGLPSGLSMASNGTISGTPNAVGSNTTSTFTVLATATDTSSSAVSTASRQFNIVVNAPVVTSFTSVGTGAWTAPTGVSAVRVLVVAGGGAGGTRNAGYGNGGTDSGAAGGAGGMIEVPSFPVSPGGNYPYQVGGGAGQNYNPTQSQGGDGTPSYFGTLTAIGGGGGGAGPGGPVADGRPGGSGGGRGGGGSASGPFGTGVQPAQPGLSGSNGYGNPGGANPNVSPYTGAGGGGAGGAGNPGGSGSVGTGGVGRSSTILNGSPIFYAGGGGGGGFPNGSVSAGNGGNGGGGAGGGPVGGNGPGNGADGSPNTGGGGGGGVGQPGGGGGGGAGGPGIIILRY
jgi:hypothetical protein